MLAVDDDPALRQLVTDYLTENELRVTAVASGAECADVMARETIDLVILDRRLKGEDGMQIARRLREGSGTAALESLRATPARFDLVLTDEAMPEMTGSELARENRKIWPDIPIVLMSGRVTPAQRTRRT